MKIRKLNNGKLLEVGDIIEFDNKITKKSISRVIRVIKTMAFIMWNEKAEGKFPRVYDWRFEPLPRSEWRTVIYTVYRPLVENNESE